MQLAEFAKHIRQKQQLVHRLQLVIRQNNYPNEEEEGVFTMIFPIMYWSRMKNGENLKKLLAKPIRYSLSGSKRL